jgi:hypothetical protein
MVRQLLGREQRDYPMSRVAPSKKILTLIIVAIVVFGGGAGAYVTTNAARNVQTLSNAQHQLTQISYHGEDGVDALTLLKKHATVGVKHYSFGDLVTTINGSAGNGPAYWTFYVNNKEASVGASSYKTKNSDELNWKLQ